MLVEYPDYRPYVAHFRLIFERNTLVRIRTRRVAALAAGALPA